MKFLHKTFFIRRTQQYRSKIFQFFFALITIGFDGHEKIISRITHDDTVLFSKLILLYKATLQEAIAQADVGKSILKVTK